MRPATTPTGVQRLARLAGRALTLRCPSCGSHGLFAGWLRMKERCPRCGLALERGEGHDYWLGAMMFNLVVAELLFVALMVAVILVSWPRVPWDFLQYGGVALMLLFPFALFPFSKTIWLAFDLAFRPAEREELWRDGAQGRR